MNKLTCQTVVFRTNLLYDHNSRRYTATRGIFDRPAEMGAANYLLGAPPITGLTEDLLNLDAVTWNHVVARLTTTKLLLEKSFGRTDEFDLHPLVREYFAERLRQEHPDAWIEGNRRLFNYYRSAVVYQPENIQDMQYLFQAAVCGCKGRLFAEALDEVYRPRISRGDVSYAAMVLGASNALLAVLTYFFKERFCETAEVQISFKCARTLTPSQAGCQTIFGEVNIYSPVLNLRYKSCGFNRLDYIQIIEYRGRYHPIPLHNETGLPARRQLLQNSY